jgi:hypothetical protein
MRPYQKAKFLPKESPLTTDNNTSPAAQAAPEAGAGLTTLDPSSATAEETKHA